MTYRLESLHLETDFDRSPTDLHVPGTTARGEALTLLDGAVRGGRIVARAAGRRALVGLRIDAPARASLRVAVTLGVDDASISAWGRSRLLAEDDWPNEEHRTRAILFEAGTAS